ncbi:S1C family serine protease [Methylobacterium sp. CM6241]
MTEGSHFVGSRTLAGLDLVRIDDRIVIENHERLVRLLRQRCGESTAALFAEPVLSHSNGSAAARVDWYTSLDGPSRNLEDLDSTSAAELRGRIRALLSGIKPLLRDPEDGPFVAACLNLATPRAVLAIGTEPLLIDWGLLPAGLLGDEQGRLRHHAVTLSHLVPDDLPMPPIGRGDWLARFRPVQPNSQIDEPVGPAPEPLGYRPGARLWTAPVVATALAGILLSLSFVPGVLAFPEPPRAISGEARTLLAAWLDNLQRRRDVLASASAFACPHLRSELPALVPQSPVGVRLPIETPTRPQARAAIGPVPAIQGSQGPAVATDPASLVGRLERGTVLVLAGDATGSGFFVSDELVITNRHVVEGAASLRIAGRHVGIVQATLVRTGGEGPLNDLALLRVPRQADIQPLALTAPGRPLTPVVAAGFPGLHLGTDPTFKRLGEGDASASRGLEPVLQTGVVNHLQRYDDAAVTLVLHSAEIAPGNSGGPLVDYCGRVVGVNSFGRSDSRLPVTARYALGTDGLTAFLAAGGENSTLDTQTCDLQAAPRETPPVATIEPGPAAQRDPAPNVAAGAAGPVPDAAPIPAPQDGTTVQPTPPRPAAPAPSRPAPRQGRDARPPVR